MATIVGSCICVQNTMVEGTCIMQMQPKGGLFPETIVTSYYHVTMATVLIGYEVVQSLMFIHTTIVK